MLDKMFTIHHRNVVLFCLEGCHPVAWVGSQTFEIRDFTNGSNIHQCTKGKTDRGVGKRMSET